MVVRSIITMGPLKLSLGNSTLPKLFYVLVLMYNRRLTSSKQLDYFIFSKDSDSHLLQSPVLFHSRKMSWQREVQKQSTPPVPFWDLQQWLLHLIEIQGAGMRKSRPGQSHFQINQDSEGKIKWTFCSSKSQLEMRSLKVSKIKKNA